MLIYLGGHLLILVAFRQDHLFCHKTLTLMASRRYAVLENMLSYL